MSVLLAFLKQNLASKGDPSVYKRLRRQVSFIKHLRTCPPPLTQKLIQVWYGTGIGFAICFIIGCGMIGAFYSLDKNVWAGTETIWEGAFALIASIIISVMGGALLRVSKLQGKWRLKLAKAIEAKNSVKDAKSKSTFKLWCQKYAMFLLPFITVLREGLEAVVFAGGVSLGYPASAFPLPVITGLAAGATVGFIIYR